MWVKTNPNPEKKEVGDCVIRALAIALDMTWTEVYDDLYLLGREWHDMMSSNEVWGLYLCTDMVLNRSCCRKRARSA